METFFQTASYDRFQRFYPNDPLKPYHDRNSTRGCNSKPVPSKKNCTKPQYISKEEMEDNWYKAMKLVPEVKYKRPPHKNFKLHDDVEHLRKRLFIKQ